MNIDSQDFFSSRYKELGGRVIPVAIKPTIRVNSLKIKDEVLLQRLEKSGIMCEKIPYLRDGYTVVSARVSPGATTEHLLGYYYVQEAAAQIPVQVLDPKPDEFVLDTCASPGGKTTQIAQYMENRGEITAYELKSHRVGALLINLERMGVTNTTVYDADFVKSEETNQFDKILVDAPCSGNFAGDSLWFEKRDYDGVLTSQKIQRDILEKAVKLLKKGGVLVYSTCSLEPEENEMNIDWAIKKLGVKTEDTGLAVGDPGITNPFGKILDSSVSKCRRFWPHKTGTEGFFLARLVKC